MSSKTKIVVLHLKELIYTGIFVLFGILFIIMLIIMFVPKDKKEENTVETPAATYVPGIYTTSLIINDKCKALAKKVKELIDTQSCFADWLSNTNVRAKLNQDLWFLLDENGYPPEWSDDVFDQVLDQVENYKEHQSAPRLYSVNTDYYPFIVAEP